ncbi:ATP-dependent exoDNAse (exonuclease V) beta subunit (contains helicase and exonuclease domains) [Abditibacterium utsteinense]|uniref:DNA 3'-5' helicase n=2 Tax=Abditibacterium utsteinense TaxID=1960156 RepID=A0A2S8SWF9_9BACT|nr:ATP-dependent exoDNAse (exonuclease V) beta subunit (contains helicase and exonuclease domains) [Abditibacterium utsteinense]
MAASATPQSLQYGPQLSPQQLKVRAHGAGNQVVVAGAGTGKTETLTQRILQLLLEGDGRGPVELEQVLALTFTDKGAAEMRGRVYARLVEILRQTPRGERRTRLENLRSNFAENNRISTFDAFSFRLLSQFARHSPFPNGVEILDGGARRELRRDTTRQFWNRAELTFSEVQKTELWELLELFPSRRAALETIADLAENELEADLDALSILPAREEWSREYAELVARGAQKLWSEVEIEVARLDLAPALRAELLDKERILAGGRAGIVTAKDWSADFTKRWSPELIPGLSRVGKRLRAWRDEAKTERDESLDWQSRVAVSRVCTHALWWQRAAREWCASRGVASFSDVAAAALEMSQIPEVAARLRGSFSHILIDEFQDTNWRQWALLDVLRDKTTGNVLIVGDEKQAIFRFRGGDITVFDAVRKILLGRDTFADELTVSRRSTQQLVGWTNTVFKGVLPTPEAREAFEAPFQALHSEKENECNGLWLLRPEKWHSPEENRALEEKLEGKTAPAATSRERAGRGLARFLRALCDDGEIHKKSGADLQFPDLAEISQKIGRGESAIGIVFTSHLAKSHFETQLRALDVPFVTVKGSGFWESEPVSWALHLLQLVLDGSERAAFVGLARSALGGLSDLALLEWHLALQSDEERNLSANCDQIEGFVPSREEDARAWSFFVARLQSWRQFGRVAPFSEVLERVLEESELAFYEAGLPDFAQREANWRKILDLVRAREAAGQGGLRALLDSFESLREDDDKEADAPLPSLGSIQLMTVFAAKGLGFPMTILAQIDDAPMSRGSRLLRGKLDEKRQMAFGLEDEEGEEKQPKPWLWETLRLADAREEEAQWRRLFYVACTRAESHLMLICPEREIKNGAAWTNLCFDAQREMSEISPATSTVVESVLNSKKVAPLITQAAPALPLQRAAQSEIALREIAGERAEKFASKARAWLEKRLSQLGSEIEDLREDVPFSTPASLFGMNQSEWLVGAWEWIAPLESGEVLLLASGSDGEIAQKRAKLMTLAAKNAGFVVRETWALWPRGEQTEALRIG